MKPASPQPTGCLGWLIWLGNTIATGVAVLGFGAVSALGGAIAGWWTASAGLLLNLQSALLGGVLGGIIGLSGGWLSTLLLDQQEQAQRKRRGRMLDWSEGILFFALMCCATLSGGFTAWLVGGSVAVQGGMLIGAVVALIGVSLLWSWLTS
jgi:hypothetical protein